MCGRGFKGGVSDHKVGGGRDGLRGFLGGIRDWEGRGYHRGFHLTEGVVLILKAMSILRNRTAGRIRTCVVIFG